MFNCGVCHLAIGPRIPPTQVVVETRPTRYLNYDEEGKPIESKGTEIVKEMNVCPDCATKQVM